MTRLAPAALCILLAGSTLAGAVRAAPLEEAVVSTDHEITVAGRLLHYTAEAGRIAIRAAETGEPHGQVFYVAYRVPSEKPRPVAFVWNGGPGASSQLLHFGVAGPRRWQDRALVDNEDTWLTGMDLVFVDPVGTGFSRPVRKEYADEFYGTVGDVASITEFVRAWRLAHGAEQNPLLLVGESWGAGRAGSVGYALEKRGIRIGALVSISGGTGISHAPLPDALRKALRIVDLSTTALHYGRLDPALGEDARLVREQAAAWARDVYAPALEQPDGLDDAARTAVIQGLSRFTGMPADRIDRGSLVIPPRAYREGLLADSGGGSAGTLGLFDMRLNSTDSAPAIEEDASRATAITGYLRHDLGYATSLPYVGLEPLDDGYAPTGEFPPSVGTRWNYATAKLSPEEVQKAIQEAIRTGSGPPRLGPPLPSAAEAVGLDPGIKVWVAAGRFDSLNSCTVNDELARYLEGSLQHAFTFACYEGGHMMYADAPARAQLSRDVRGLAKRLE